MIAHAHEAEMIRMHCRFPGSLGRRWHFSAVDQMLHLATAAALQGSRRRRAVQTLVIHSTQIEGEQSRFKI